MRLDKLLEETKTGSRNQVKKLIRAQSVCIDGHPAQSGRQNVDPGLQTITVHGREIDGVPHAYYLLNKPSGVVCARSDAQHQTVIDLIADRPKPDGLYPVGRLDRDTKGLVLITNNGPLGFRMLHPKHHVTKTYKVTVNGFLGADAPCFFNNGIVFPDGTSCKPAQLVLHQVSDQCSQAEVTLVEGKFHQVKKMFLTYGVKVTALERVAFAGLELGDLKVGDYRQLTTAEKNIIRSYLT
ncbi:pseudouridine synthase [Streptococcus phocae subsp. phocae]|uniref:Pseudouridine synthase n=1 Tax=Streptococcus phocae TaxID=119224 RepID=A0A0P6S699_9STRE|nr:pseudouridine synthase [Streptococcus phocae]KPJ22680.1 16S rRNA pseudouridylate synthase [Streptococcus phocae]